jgi:hypothetical protein
VPAREAETSSVVRIGEPLMLRGQVATMPDGRSRYRFKQWMASEPEPRGWDVQGFKSGDHPSGSACIVPHNADVTVHRISVTAVDADAKHWGHVRMALPYDFCIDVPPIP